MEMTDKERAKAMAAIDAAKEKVLGATNNLIAAQEALKSAINHPDFLGNPPTAIAREIDLAMAVEAQIINYSRNSNTQNPFSNSNFNGATTTLLG